MPKKKPKRKYLVNVAGHKRMVTATSSYAAELLAIRQLIRERVINRQPTHVPGQGFLGVITQMLDAASAKETG